MCRNRKERRMTPRPDLTAEVLSSKTRLRILDLLSRRPRTLRELASSTGISVQGVLRHLEAMIGSGLIEEKDFRGNEFPVRKIYSLKGAHVSDFSAGNLTVVRAEQIHGVQSQGSVRPEELEMLSGDLLVRRRRIRQKAKRLARMIDELAEDEVRLIRSIDAMNLKDDEKLVIQTVFTEETLQDAENSLSKVQGLPGARRSIDRALAKARSIAKK